MKNIVKNTSANTSSSVKKTLKCFCIVAPIFIIFLLFFHAFEIFRYSQVDETRYADAAIILGAGIENNAPTPVFRERLNHGIWLYQNGYVPLLILTGGYGENHDASDAMDAKNYVLEQGIPSENIFIEEQSRITEENLYYTQKIMEEQHCKDALIISDPLHMKRAMLLAEDLGIKAYSSPTRTSMYKSWQTKNWFLAREVFFYVGYKIYRLF